MRTYAHTHTDIKLRIRVLRSTSPIINRENYQSSTNLLIIGEFSVNINNESLDRKTLLSLMESIKPELASPPDTLETNQNSQIELCFTNSKID